MLLAHQLDNINYKKNIELTSLSSFCVLNINLEVDVISNKFGLFAFFLLWNHFFVLFSNEIRFYIFSSPIFMLLSYIYFKPLCSNIVSFIKMYIYWL